MGSDAMRIQPWSVNPRYWQYRGEPILLPGATNADNAFQMPDLDEQLRNLTEAAARSSHCIRRAGMTGSRSSRSHDDFAASG